MKKLAILLVLLSSLVAKSQNYIPMPFEDGMLWRTDFGDPSHDYAEEHRVISDTLIAGFHYHKVGFYSTQFGNGPTGTYFFREDTLSKKIFFRSALSAEVLLYNFNLNVGDTIRTYQLSMIISDTVRVGFIDSVLLNGVYHKRFNSTPFVTSAGPWASVYRFIEGIGSESGFLTITNSFERGSWLKCVGKYYNQTLYPDSLFECIYATPTQDYNLLHRIQLYPNPSSDVLHIHTGEVEFEVSISDVFGNILLANKSYQENSTIDISSFPVGMYAVQIVIKNGVLMNRKFVKE